MILSDVLDYEEAPEDFEYVKHDHETDLKGLASCFCTRTLRYLEDDSDGAFFLAGFEHGDSWIIRARSFEAAWDAWVDELPTIPREELIEAYGLDGESFLDLARNAAGPMPRWGTPECDAWSERYHDNARDMLSQTSEDADGSEAHPYPELVEGYEYQSNASGTGVVCMGHYAHMREADDEELARITVRRKDPKT